MLPSSNEFTGSSVFRVKVILSVINMGCTFFSHFALYPVRSQKKQIKEAHAKSRQCSQILWGHRGCDTGLGAAFFEALGKYKIHPGVAQNGYS